ncbi:NAD(P)-binding protein [Gonapodya prolifera JEL478]|uniref:NAD(P)-binding protein n=1 Tax=Gonapodya prolifera (strain JEL478) TaxID=1344416 RepID=A0A139AXB4_GONPJ|nr:NAD(P)-binding protein [Gonapodya prolifera JEL478]|eukprot:KXS21391.1 NAD(P)-binding protein [Gonapodya prolifera JEL478]
MKVALIAGANGITGSYLIEHLLSSGEWTIIAISRREPNSEWIAKDLPPNALGSGRLRWIAADLYRAGEHGLVELFEKNGVADVEHLFWAAYAVADGWGTDSELEMNTKMFQNCLRAVSHVAGPRLKRVLLQLGGKWHIRKPAPKLPFRESAEPPNLPIAGFYTAQHKVLLEEHARKTGNWDWVVVLPNAILGHTRQAQMTLATTIAIWATVKATLGQPLNFPGTLQAYEAHGNETSADLLAEFLAWAATKPECALQVINCVNGDVHPWSTTWPLIAAYFGCAPPDQNALRSSSVDSSKPSFAAEGDIDDASAEKTWRMVCDRDKRLDVDAWKYGFQGLWFLDVVMSGQTSSYWSMSKARQLGFAGYRDTEESLWTIFDRMAKDGSLPNDLPGREGVKRVLSDVTL